MTGEAFLGPVGAVLGSLPPPPGNEIGPFRIYGLMIATGVVAAVWLARHRYTAAGGDSELVDRVAFWGVLAGLVGARVGFVLPRLDQFGDDPLSAFAVWEGGLTFFGGLAGGLAAGWWALRRQQAPIAMFLTAIAPAIPLAQAIGRWGNYFNQELYGRPTDLPWGLEIEPAHRVAGYQAHDTFHPAFLYEVLWNIALVAILIWAGRRLRLRDGSLFLLYLVGYGIGRFWLELLRIDTEFRFLGLSRNSYNSLLIVAIGLAGLWWWQRRAPVPEPDPEDEEAEPADTNPREASTSTPA